MSAIHDKIKKLIALGENNSNEHESKQALAAASMLMMRHGIDRADLGEKPTVLEGTLFDIEHKWYRIVASAAAELYGVSPFYAQTRGQNDKCRFVGRQDNIDAAQDTLAFLILQVDFLYRQNLPKGMSKTERAQYRRSFKESCAMRVYHRAKEVVAEQLAADAKPSSGTALVVLAHREQLKVEVNDYFAGMSGIKYKQTKVSGRVNRGTIEGRAAGDKVDLNRKVG